MRLIDADALIEKMNKETSHPPELVYEHIIVDDFIKRLEEAPTVDAITVDDVAKMLADLFGDCIACNYNEIDQYIAIDCEKNACPDDGDYSCWKKYVMYLIENERAKMDGGAET